MEDIQLQEKAKQYINLIESSRTLDFNKMKEYQIFSDENLETLTRFREGYGDIKFNSVLEDFLKNFLDKF